MSDKGFGAVGITSGVLGNGKQDYGVLGGMQAMTGVGNDDQVAGGSFPRVFSAGQGNAAMKDMHCRLARILVFVEGVPGCQGNHGLPEGLFMPAIHRVGAAPAGCMQRYL